MTSFNLHAHMPDPVQKQAAASAQYAQSAIQTIAAMLTRCRHGQALVVLDSAPFNGLEIRPGDLRQLAQQLTAIADIAARLPMGGKHWKPTRIELGGVNPVTLGAMRD